MTADALVPTTFNWKRFLAVAGPGIVVMLADTDAGSVITAAQSGAQWGYSLLLLQVVLIPILYIVQELTVRLGAVTGKGHAALIKQHFGSGWAWFSVATLILTCLGALLSEFAGLAGVGSLIGVPAPVTLGLVVVAMLAMALMNGYATVERIAIGVGAFELVFLLVAMLAQPGLAEMASGAITIPATDPKYLLLVSANIGAVIMPWMVFFQQSSIVEKGITTRDLGSARMDTAIGAVATQVIMAAVLVATAATLGKAGGDHALDTVEEIVGAITPFLGNFAGKLLFCLGMIGAATVAAIVVTLTAARTLAEVLGAKHKLEDEPREAPWFYGFYALALIVCAVVVASGVNLISLSVGVQVMNALLLPIVLGFLFLLARRLPGPYRLQGTYAVVRRRDHPGDGCLRRLFRRRGLVGVSREGRSPHKARLRGPSASVARFARRRPVLGILPPPLGHELIELGPVFGEAQPRQEVLERLLLVFEPLQRLLAIIVEGAVAARGRAEAVTAAPETLHASAKALHLVLHPGHLALPAVPAMLPVGRRPLPGIAPIMAPAAVSSAPRDQESEKEQPDGPPPQKPQDHEKDMHHASPRL